MVWKDFEKGGDSSGGIYIQSTSDIPPNWDDMRSIADITKLYEIGSGFFSGSKFYIYKVLHQIMREVIK